MDAYRAWKQGYGHTLTIIHVQKDEERGKTTWGKSSLKKRQGTKFEQHVFKYVFILILMS